MIPPALTAEAALRQGKLGRLLAAPHPAPATPPLPTPGPVPVPVPGGPVAAAPPTADTTPPPPPAIAPPPASAIASAPTPAGGSVPGAAGGSGGRWAVLSSRGAGAAAGAAVVTAAVALAVSLPGRTDGNTTTPAPTPTSAAPSAPPAAGAAAAGALPAAWSGTWSGTGPGTPDADGISRARTGEFTVTVTLNGGTVGELVGRQVSNLKETATGRSLGCTEALQLRQTRGNTAVFEAVTSHPTDRTAVLDCPRNNLYVLTMTGPDRLTLESEGAQSAGAPTALTRTP